MRDIVNWQKMLAQGFNSANALLAHLQLPPCSECDTPEMLFKTRVPLGFANRMQRGNPNDPLLLQVLARGEETWSPPEYHTDPLEEIAANPLAGLIHKYPGRVLLTLTGVCAINCRYCFRRHFPYEHNNPGRQGWQSALDYIRNNLSIEEVILSGGDPLMASDTVIASLIAGLQTIDHVRTLRIHTRIPIVLPQRITPALLDILSNTRFHRVLVLHCNHAQELDDTVLEACRALKQAGYHLLNQSVLLRGINDQAETLATLSRRLFDYGILPYYLHLLDKVHGASHFDVALQQAGTIYKELQEKLPGYLVPRLAREESGKRHKTLISVS